MIDLKNPHIIPLEYMSDEHIGAILRAHSQGADIEFADGTHWHSVGVPQWRFNIAYRLAPTKDTIDWSHVDPKWAGMVRACTELLFLVKEKPRLETRNWVSTTWVNATGFFSSYKRGTCEWEESWVPNPLHNK